MSTPMATDEPVKSRRPKDTKFKQQKLPAWQPIMTAGTVLPAFFAIGIAFIPLGVALLFTSDSVQEVSRDYTRDCVPNNSLALSGNYSNCAAYLEAYKHSATGAPETCLCTINVTLDTAFKGKVYLYYGLTNFYQNHRRYVKSRDDNQLGGADVNSVNDLINDCEPFRGYENSTYSVPYAPCGAIANSLFNDTIALKYYGEDGTESATTVGLLNTGIAWSTDKEVKFENPDTFNGTLQPRNWKIKVDELDLSNPDNNGYKNEDLIVWMRTAALPTFRKLYRRISHNTAMFAEGLPKGEYQFSVEYNFPVTGFDGSKRLILTTTSWMGGKNPFLGIAYLVVGSICIVLGIVFLIIHIRVGKKPMDMISNINNRSEY